MSDHTVDPNLFSATIPAAPPRHRGPVFEAFGLTPADAATFGGDVRVRADAIFGRARDGLLRGLGWETVLPDAAGKTRTRYTEGAPRGLVVEAHRGGIDSILLVEGLVAALAARALLRGERRHRVVALSGGWTPVAASHVGTFAMRAGIRRVVVGNSTHHDAGRRLRAGALESLTALFTAVEELAPPPAGWAAALRARRLGTVAS